VSGQAQVALMPDGRRLHLHHGPIDILAEAFGPAEQRALAYRQAADRFSTVLEELVDELALLRAPMTDAGLPVEGAVARRMVAAVWPHREVFVTPMAAVAGAVADEVLAAMVAGRNLEKAYVNDGGDVSLFLTPGRSLRAGVVTDQDVPAIDGRIELSHAMPVRGLATSGWRGRSFSLGIADAVTVLARTGAAADAAATLIANAVDADHPAVRRRPARDLRDDTDLGDLPVTVEVGPLPRPAIDQALAGGAERAEAMRRAGLIFAAALFLQGGARAVGPLAAPTPSSTLPLHGGGRGGGDNWEGEE
jgi:ApbE superfamily uncharacterized protein (UPF0280 family)